jgi:hypothetical protein
MQGRTTPGAIVRVGTKPHPQPGHRRTSATKSVQHAVPAHVSWEQAKSYASRNDEDDHDEHGGAKPPAVAFQRADVVRRYHLTRHKISCRESSVHATQHTLTRADTPSVNDRLARGQLHRLIRSHGELTLSNFVMTHLPSFFWTSNHSFDPPTARVKTQTRSGHDT